MRSELERVLNGNFLACGFQRLLVIEEGTLAELPVPIPTRIDHMVVPSTEETLFLIFQLIICSAI